MATRRLLVIALAVAITFTQEQLLVFLPNIQFTVLLMFVFASVFNYKEMFVYVFVYVLIDSLYMGGFNLFYMMPMLIAWFSIAFVYQLFLKNSSSIYKKAIFAALFGFYYGWAFIPFNMIQMGMSDFVPYLVADLPFEIIMSITGFLTVLWGYEPLVKVVREVAHEPVGSLKKY